MISQEGIKQDIDYCRKTVMENDYERYVLSMAAPAKARPALWAVMAFAYEIAKTREVASGLAGHMRLTWWRDAVLQETTGHEVLRALLPCKLDKDLLLQMIEARRTEVDNIGVVDLSATACQQNLPLFQLCAQILGVDDGDLAGLATAYGLVGLVRSLGFYAQKGQVVLPAHMLGRLGLEAEQISHLKPSAELNQIVADIITTAKAHRAVGLSKEVVAQSSFFRSALAMVDFYIERVLACGFNPFCPKLINPVPFLGIRVLLRQNRV